VTGIMRPVIRTVTYRYRYAPLQREVQSTYK